MQVQPDFLQAVKANIGADNAQQFLSRAIVTDHTGQLFRFRALGNGQALHQPTDHFDLVRVGMNHTINDYLRVINSR